MAEPTPETRDQPGKGGETAKGGDWLTENLEAIVIAVIMALVIRHFCIEAFKIPTSSMEPTLIGKEEGGDRILVNKFTYRFREPRRWEVVVFKYPLNKTKNFIKRLVGLPNEVMKLQGGDVYVRKGEEPFRIVRKPVDVQEAVWQEVFPVEDAEWSRGIGRAADGVWQPVGDATFEGGTLEEGRERTLRPAEGQDEAFLYYTGTVRAHGEEVEMGDVKVSFDALAGPGCTEISGVVSYGAETFAYRLRAEGESVIERNGTVVARSPTTLPRGGRVAVAFVHVDGQARLVLDGEEACAFAYEPDASKPYHTLRAVLKVGARDGSLAVSRMKIYRDIYYFADRDGRFRLNGSLSIGPDQYVMLGDNSSSSKDSRLWTKIRYERTDGTVVEGDADTSGPQAEGQRFVRDESRGEIHLIDINGRKVVLTRDEVKDFDAQPQFAPFVPRENLIGQAFMVFWPMKQLKLIR